MWGDDGVTGTGNEIIFDFEAGAGVVDVIDLAGSEVTSFAQLQSEGRLVHESVYTHNLLVKGNDLYLQNRTVGSLVAGDFAFV